MSIPGCDNSARSLLPAALAAVLFFGCGARAASWSGHVGRMNRTAITESKARERDAGEERDRRNRLALRRIKPAMPGVDWNTDPTAIPYFLYQVNKRTDLPVYVDNEGLDLASDELFENSVVYMTSHTAWSFDAVETKNIALFLRRGGTLYLDDCYNKGSAFTDSTFVEVPKFVPGGEPETAIPEAEEVRGIFDLVYPGVSWPGSFMSTRPWQYFLVDGRPAVFFSPNDDGCAWEVSTPPSASNPIGEPIGHGGDNTYREWSYKITTSWILFAYTH